MSSYDGVDVLDSIIDLNNFEKPVKRQVQTIFTIGSTQIFKELHIFLKSGIVSTDSGWLLEDLNQISYLKIDKDREFSREVLPGENQIARIFLRMSNLQELFQRKYDKVQEVAANVGIKHLYYYI